jgi:hypothetical protein
LVTVFFIGLLWGPWWIDAKYLTKNLSSAQATAVTGFRTTLVAVGAAIAAGVGAIIAARTVRVHRDGQVTDRYSKAIEQLASDDETSQLGGIYALERIMRDSPKDEPTVILVLATFIRDKSPSPNRGIPRDVPALSNAVKAAIGVLGHRSKQKLPFQIDLSCTNLGEANFEGANLEHANLMGAYLAHASLCGANLEHANLMEVNLFHANLKNAILDHADISGIDLSAVKNLTPVQVLRARPNGSTIHSFTGREKTKIDQRIARLRVLGTPMEPGGKPCGCYTGVPRGTAGSGDDAKAGS